MQRYAMVFRVRPGTEEQVAHLLSNYDPPKHRVDDETRLVSTSVFMKDNMVVRMIEFEGQLPKLMAHLSRDPSVQRVERELDQYLADEDKRDMSHPDGVRQFFARVLMTTITTRVAIADRPTATAVN
jgi:hypothetical protein